MMASCHCMCSPLPLSVVQASEVEKRGFHIETLLFKRTNSFR